jgi:hypothetical protein
MKNLYTSLSLLLACFSFANSSFSQSGCTDIQANNYNSNAAVNNGSCTYNITNDTYTAVTNLSATINETSGLIFWRNYFWTHNDSGGANAIYSLDSTTGNVIQTVTITNATNIDWEDIAQDNNFIYIGDFGNNVNGNRTNLRIYKIAKADITNAAAVNVTAEIINFNYSDQTNFAPTGSNNTDFDCEALFAKGDSLYMFSKNWLNFQTRLYRLPKIAGTYSAQYLQTFNTDGLITGADYNAVCNRVVLSGYRRVANGATFIWNLFDFAGTDFFGGNKRRIETQIINSTGQVEGICFLDGNTIYTTRENNVTFGGTQRLARLLISPYTGNCLLGTLPMQLVYIQGKNQNGINEIHFKCTGDNIERYELEKRNGDIFFTIANASPNRNKEYILQDIQPSGEKNFYRIKSINLDGQVNYSAVLLIAATHKPPALVAVGNTGKLSITFIPAAEKGYQLRIFDVHGREVYQLPFSFSIAQEIYFSPKLSSGIYHIWVRLTDGRIITRKLILMN